MAETETPLKPIVLQSRFEKSSLVARSPLLQHLHQSYPVLNEATAYVLSFSLFQSAVALVSSWILTVKRLSDVYLPVFNATTDYLEVSLIGWFFAGMVDAYFPHLKTLHLSDFAPSNLYFFLLNKFYTLSVYKKSTELGHDVLKQVNVRLSKYDEKAEIVNSNSTELQKFVKITKSLLSQLKAYPFELQTHVQQVYNDEFSKNNQNSIKAFASASNELASEFTTKLTKAVKKKSSSSSFINYVTAGDDDSAISSTANDDAFSTAINGHGAGFSNGNSNRVDVDVREDASDDGIISNE